MISPVHQTAADLLLAAVFPTGHPDGLVSSFFFGKPGAPLLERRIGMEISFGRNELLRAALYVRRNGPPYLQDARVEEVWSVLQNFVIENFGIITDGQFGFTYSDPCKSYATGVSPFQRLQFAAALASSAIFQPDNTVHLFALVPIRVIGQFICDPFFIAAPPALEAALTPLGLWNRSILPEQFPPLKDWKYRKECPSAWLGVRSPTLASAKKVAAIILGAIALAPRSADRYSFSMRRMFGGICSLGSSNASVTGFESPLTPPLMHDLILTTEDGRWLKLLSDKLRSTDKSVRRELHALRYFYWAWPLDPTERFPILCMALDALYGDAKKATQAVIDGVRSTTGVHVNESRLRLLLQLRGEVVHGRAPTVYDADEYERYYLEYEEDPVTDMEIVTSFCLRNETFGGLLVEHPDPNAAIVAEMQAAGRLPKKLNEGRGILDG